MQSATSQRPGLLAAGASLLLLGFVARLLPLLDATRLLKQWPTEDGYLMLTIARNIALGLGMSTSAGEIPTNGTQPLATWLWAAGYAAVDADKTSGVLVALVLQLAFSVAAAWLMYQVARRVFGRLGIDAGWALLATGAWYSSTLVVPHSMNCLESGLYVLLVLGAALLYLEAARGGDDGGIELSWGAAAASGLLLGVCFYGRNDSSLLIAGWCMSYLLVLGARPGLRLRNLGKAVLTGGLSVVVALPWLVNNVLSFGSLVPISGLAQSEMSGIGAAAPLLPVKLAEYFSVVLPVPHSIERHPAVVAGCGLVALGCLALLARGLLRLAPSLRPFAFVFASFFVLLAAYYGIYHGAPHFLARYLFPVSPFFALAAFAALAFAAGRFGPQALPRLQVGVALVALVVSSGLHARLYAGGNRHQHEQVVQWVAANVRDTDWIGAVQTGTLGYFHDRTVNLDGKVNPEALAHVLAGTIPDYVNQKGLVVLADWVGIARWVELPPLAGNFRVMAEDPARNLGVLARNGWEPVAPPQPVLAGFAPALERPIPK